MAKLIAGDPDERFRLLLWLARRLAPTYRFKWPSMAWWDDEDFNGYLESFAERGGLNTDRKWMLRQLLRLIEAVAGDTAECGVYQGASSYLICEAGGRGPYSRRHFVFDSFEGLSEPEPIDGGHWRRGDLAAGVELASSRLARYPHVRFLKGWIPERFDEVADRRFAFVHIDVDLAQPTLDSLTFFYHRMNAGGVILCDDYGFTTCPGVTRVVDAYFADKPEKMLALSCGGGFVIKGIATASRYASPTRPRESPDASPACGTRPRGAASRCGAEDDEAAA